MFSDTNKQKTSVLDKDSSEGGWMEGSRGKGGGGGNWKKERLERGLG